MPSSETPTPVTKWDIKHSIKTQNKDNISLILHPAFSDAFSTMMWNELVVKYCSYLVTYRINTLQKTEMLITSLIDLRTNQYFTCIITLCTKIYT